MARPGTTNGTNICWSNGTGAEIVPSSTATSSTKNTTYVSGMGICYYLKEVRDVPLTGILYTWSNNRGDSVAVATATSSTPSMLTVLCNSRSYVVDLDSQACKMSHVQVAPMCATAGACSL